MEQVFDQVLKMINKWKIPKAASLEQFWFQPVTYVPEKPQEEDRVLAWSLYNASLHHFSVEVYLLPDIPRAGDTTDPTSQRMNSSSLNVLRNKGYKII